MDIDLLFWMIGATTVIFYVVCYLLVRFGDCDIPLQFNCRYGKRIASLKGKVIWITGASSGLGEQLAYELAQVGAKLILSARGEQELDRVKRACLKLGGSVEKDILILKLNLLEMESHKSAVEEVLKYFKKIDIFINNAGRAHIGEWIKTSVAVDEELLRTNILGPLSLMKCVLPYMVGASSGHIVDINSLWNKIGVPMSGSSAGSKSAMTGWLKSLRAETHRHDIVVTSICAGPFFSKCLLTALTEDVNKEFKREMHPSEPRMSTKRCAYLTTVAISNKVDEAWISVEPGLMYMYLNQYFPNVASYANKFLKSIYARN